MNKSGLSILKSWVLAFGLLGATLCLAQSNPEVFVIDGRLEAVFAGQPSLIGNVEHEDGKRTRTHAYSDEQNLVMYTGTCSQVSPWPDDEAQMLLKAYADSQVRGMGGTQSKFRSTTVHGRPAYEYNFRYSPQGISAIKWALVSHKGNHVCQWAIQTYPGHTRVDGAAIFNTYRSHFRMR